MDKRITIQAKSQSSDGAGGFTDSWAQSHQAWAYVAPTTGFERWRGEQMETPVTHKFVMNYQTGITTAHRISYDSRVFNITEVLNIDEADVILELQAVEGAAT